MRNGNGKRSKIGGIKTPTFFGEDKENVSEESVAESN